MKGNRIASQKAGTRAEQLDRLLGSKEDDVTGGLLEDQGRNLHPLAVCAGVQSKVYS